MRDEVGQPDTNAVSREIPILGYAPTERQAWWRWSAQSKAARIASLIVIAAILLEFAGISLALYSESQKQGPYVPPICYKYDYVITAALLGALAANIVSPIFSAMEIRRMKRVSGFNFIVLTANCLSLSWNVCFLLFGAI